MKIKVNKLGTSFSKYAKFVYDEGPAVIIDRRGKTEKVKKKLVILGDNGWITWADFTNDMEMLYMMGMTAGRPEKTETDVPTLLHDITGCLSRNNIECLKQLGIDGTVYHVTTRWNNNELVGFAIKGTLYGQPAVIINPPVLRSISFQVYRDGVPYLNVNMQDAEKQERYQIQVNGADIMLGFREVETLALTPFDYMKAFIASNGCNLIWTKLNSETCYKAAIRRIHSLEDKKLLYGMGTPVTVIYGPTDTGYRVLEHFFHV